MKSIVSLCIVVYVFACMLIEIETFSSIQSCIDKTVELVKEKRSDLSTEFLLSYKWTSEALRNSCNYYVSSKIRKVIKLAKKECLTPNIEIPTISELNQQIYEDYVRLLHELNLRGEITQLPNSLSQFIDHWEGGSQSFFFQRAGSIAGSCLHKDVNEIE